MYVYDLETYPNVFTCSAVHVDSNQEYTFEISSRRNDLNTLREWVLYLRAHREFMVGFNNLAFDYPILHRIMHHDLTPWQIYQFVQEIFAGNRFQFIVWDREQIVPQIDLFKIHHFDNVARSTSLKVLEFNMRSHSIEDLPFPPGTELHGEQIDTLIGYNLHDVRETVKFLRHSMDHIAFRQELTNKYQRSFINHNDTKIGKDFLIMRLEQANIPCYQTDPITGRREPVQTLRTSIPLADVILPSVQFFRPEFQRILEWFRGQRIVQTKGTFKNLAVTVDGFEFVFGTGGIHGSVESRHVQESDEYALIDLDVTSYYPSLAIVNRLYPEHLGSEFVDIYRDVMQERGRHKKGSAINAMLKLALNGVYGDSNNPYSPFYDSAYTMAITINGQLLLCMLAELLMSIPGLRMIQANTDGLTVQCPRQHLRLLDEFTDYWQQQTSLNLERAEYSDMWIRDVNNYLARYVDGKVKRKGAYEYEREWHQNHSALVVPKVVERCLLYGNPVDEEMGIFTDPYDWCLRAKVPRSSRLMLGDRQIQNTSRYHIAHRGGPLVKVMPPLPGKHKERPIGINVGWVVNECNNMDHFDAAGLNREWYRAEIEKLLLTP